MTDGTMYENILKHICVKQWVLDVARYSVASSCHSHNSNVLHSHSTADTRYTITRYTRRMKMSEDIVLVVLCGWAGSQARHLKNYQALMEQVIGNVAATLSEPRQSRLSWKNSPRTNICPEVVTVSASLPVEYIFSPVEWPRRVWTRDNVLKNIERYLEEYDACGRRTRILVYAFSNGGGFVVEQLYKMLSKEDRLGVQERIKGILFDSAPGYDVGGRMGKRVLQEVLGTSHWYSKVGVEIAHSCQRVLAKMLSPQRQDVYWDIMQDIHWCPILYIYSEDDHLCDADKLYALILEKIRRGHRVKRVCWEQSKHCAHYIKHRQGYTNAIRDFLVTNDILFKPISKL